MNEPQVDESILGLETSSEGLESSCFSTGDFELDSKAELVGYFELVLITSVPLI